MQEIRKELKSAISKLYGIDFNVEIVPAPENIEADYSSNVALKLAKELHKAPMEIAKDLVAEIEIPSFARGLESEKSHTLDSQENRPTGEPLGVGRNIDFSDSNQNFILTKEGISISAPGFINFRLADSYLAEAIDGFCEDFKSEIAADMFKGKTVICEFSDPNPFKVLHVGHLYDSITGDSISRLFEYAGAKVIRANFGGDVGLHVAKTMYILQQKPIEDLAIDDIARCYVEGTAAYEESEEAKKEIVKLNKEIYKINAEDLHDSKLAELYWKGRELSYEYFEDFYASIGLKFDKYYPESSVAALGLKTVKEQLEKGVYEMSDGAVIFDGEKYGLHTRVFINKEGVPTYEAKDVGLIFTKWEDYHFDKSVVITGNEQLEYMRVVLKSVEQYAPELVEKTSHLTHGLVKLPGNEKMSSRKGNFLKAVDVLEMVKNEFKKVYDSSDEKVSLAATKYAFLKYKMGGNIIFDPKESVKMTGNSGPYLLYSAVRAKKIIAKFEDFETMSREPYEASEATEARDDGPERARSKKLQMSERSLMRKILEYKNTLAEAVAEMAPHKLANYLYETAQEFSRFYEKCPVVGSEKEAERVKLVKVYCEVMTHGLDILGIEIPEKM